jgi:hypothetical protein
MSRGWLTVLLLAVPVFYAERVVATICNGIVELISTAFPTQRIDFVKQKYNSAGAVTTQHGIRKLIVCIVVLYVVLVYFVVFKTPPGRGQMVTEQETRKVAAAKGLALEHTSGDTVIVQRDQWKEAKLHKTYAVIGKVFDLL